MGGFGISPGSKTFLAKDWISFSPCFPSLPEDELFLQINQDGFSLLLPDQENIGDVCLSWSIETYRPYFIAKHKRGEKKKAMQSKREEMCAKISSKWAYIFPAFKSLLSSPLGNIYVSVSKQTAWLCGRNDRWWEHLSSFYTYHEAVIGVQMTENWL